MGGMPASGLLGARLEPQEPRPGSHERRGWQRLGAATVSPAAGARVLVVDDEPAILRAVQTNLARHGFRVETAETGRGALEAHARFHPDLLLLDLGLPDID